MGRLIEAIDARGHAERAEIGAPVPPRVTVPSARTATAEGAEAKVGAGVAAGAAATGCASVGTEAVGMEISEVIG